MLTIGSRVVVVSINDGRDAGTVTRREKVFSILEHIGTYEPHWETNARQVGFQGGKYFTASANQTWTKNKGMTLKEVNLQRDGDNHLICLLDQNWGLQISLCTGVARRVSLCELVADLLPVFIDPLYPEEWHELKDNHNVEEALTRCDVVDWICKLPEIPKNLRKTFLILLRNILDHLRHTGLNQQKTHATVAWPAKKDIARGVKIPCEHAKWAQLVTDTRDCATFAYVTKKCLQTQNVKCQGRQGSWQNASVLLETEVSPFHPTNALPSLRPTEMTTPMVGWSLEEDHSYYVEKMDSTSLVRARRSEFTSNSIWPVDMNTDPLQRVGVKLRERIKKSKTYIRERQAQGDPAEFVLVGMKLMRT